MNDRLRMFIESLADQDIEDLLVIGKDVLAHRRQGKSDLTMITLRWLGPGMWAKRATGYCSAQPSAFGILGDFIQPGPTAHNNGSYLVIGGGIADRQIKKSLETDPWSMSDRSFYALLRVKKGARTSFRNGAYEIHGENVELLAESNTPGQVKERIAQHPHLARLVGRPIFPIIAGLADAFADTPYVALNQNPKQAPYSAKKTTTSSGHRGPRKMIPGPRGRR